MYRQNAIHSPFFLGILFSNPSPKPFHQRDALRLNICPLPTKHSEYLQLHFYSDWDQT